MDPLFNLRFDQYGYILVHPGVFILYEISIIDGGGEYLKRLGRISVKTVSISKTSLIKWNTMGNFFEKIRCQHKWNTHGSREETYNKFITIEGKLQQFVYVKKRDVLICSECGKIKIIEY
jgi:hypothetical protein